MAAKYASSFRVVAASHCPLYGLKVWYKAIHWD